MGSDILVRSFFIVNVSRKRINVKCIQEITLYRMSQKCVEWCNFKRINVFELKYIGIDNNTFLVFMQERFAFYEEIEEGNIEIEFNYV